jgi:hypothetical protein
MKSAEGVRLDIDKIIVGPRILPENKALVEELKESIKEVGQLQPIIVCSIKDSIYNYDLAAGFHRLIAMKELNFEKITANVRLPEEREFIEITENLKRQHLSIPQRDMLSGRLLGLQLQARERAEAEAREKAEAVAATAASGDGTDGSNCATGTDGSNRAISHAGPQTDPWFREWYEAANIPKRTAHRRWDAFILDNPPPAGKQIEPGQADAPMQDAFRVWLTNQEKSDAERQAATQKAEQEARAKAKKEQTFADLKERMNCFAPSLNPKEAADAIPDQKTRNQVRKFIVDAKKWLDRLEAALQSSSS